MKNKRVQESVLPAYPTLSIRDSYANDLVYINFSLQELRITSPVLPKVLITQVTKAMPQKRTFQTSLADSNQDGIGCSSMHLKMVVLKKLRGYETPSKKEEQKSASGQFKTLTKQEFDAVEKAIQCYLASQSTQPTFHNLLLSFQLQNKALTLGQS